MRAAAYARYSTNNQTENSIEYQLAEIRRYCAAHEIPITATFTDEGRSDAYIKPQGCQAGKAAATPGAPDH